MNETIITLWVAKVVIFERLGASNKFSILMHEFDHQLRLELTSALKTMQNKKLSNCNSVCVTWSTNQLNEIIITDLVLHYSATPGFVKH